MTKTIISSLNRPHIVGLLSLVVLLVALPLTIFLLQQRQERRQRAAGTYFTTLPPGSILPTEAGCASRVRRTSWEPRLDNYAANHRVPTAQQLVGLDPTITGNFMGTTDEVLQWTACRWGIDEDIVRAQAVNESHWHQSTLGDITDDRSLCPPGNGYPGAWNGSSCYQSYGILQDKYIYNKSAWPLYRDDTAFAAEYSYSIVRNCFEGRVTYLASNPPLPGYPAYHAGDIWGCLGSYYSGKWYDQDAIDYINIVKYYYVQKPWLNW